MAKLTCEKCGRQMEDTNFYTYRDGTKVDTCKRCLTMHIDNFDENTYLWILEKMDVPYIPEEWNILRDKQYAKYGKLTPISVIGKYLSKMRLTQFKDKSWKDSAQLQEERKKKEKIKAEARKAEEDLAKEQFERGQISEAQYRTLVSTETQNKNEGMIGKSKIEDQIKFFKNEDNFLPEEELPDATTQLTLDQKRDLVLKWGRTYTFNELVQLEKKYWEMMNSFDIQDADSKNTLILICKTDLKSNQALDMGDYEGYQKLARVSDSLRKSAKFTAAQNKEKENDFIDSVGQLVAYCEKFGHKIPRYDISTPQDIVDKVILDLKEYNKNLIYGDTALARQIEDYIKNAKIAMEQKQNREQAKAQGLDAVPITDEDILEYKDFLKKEREENEKIIRGDENVTEKST